MLMFSTEAIIQEFSGKISHFKILATDSKYISKSPVQARQIRLRVTLAHESPEMSGGCIMLWREPWTWLQALDFANISLLPPYLEHLPKPLAYS